MSQHDGHHHASSGRILRLALTANAVLLVVQVVGAVAFSSLALLADAGHQGSDVAALLIAVVAQTIAGRAPSDNYTFGLRRAEVMGALLNGVMLLAVAVWVVVEASRRIGDPPDVSGWGVLLLGMAGLLVNGGCAWLLHRSADRSLNVRGAALHLTGDAAGSVGVVVAGLAVVLWSADWVDSAVSYLIAGLLLWTGTGLVRRTTRVLLEGTPPGMDVSELSALITADERVNGVHHLHVWSVDSTTVALSAHVEVAADSLHDAQLVATHLERQLALRGVDHATLALECHPCNSDHEHD
ncbi:MAG: cation diffusion facilitator family transporter [Actinomycetota bacterium]|nr:cation diffusion facilitator family transporter [Actinomycetota bacterium]